MENNEQVSSIMTRNLITTTKDGNIYDVINLMKKHHIRHLPVLENEKVVGIISSTDINRLTFGNLFDNQDVSDEPILNMLSIEQIMAGKPVTVNANESIKNVAEKFAKAEFHAMPVVDNENVVGIVTTTDLIKYLINQYELV